jgi:hypothetical protein
VAKVPDLDLGGDDEPTEAADDASDFAALRQLQHRAAVLGCEESAEALAVALTHLFADAPEEWDHR